MLTGVSIRIPNWIIYNALLSSIHACMLRACMLCRACSLAWSARCAEVHSARMHAQRHAMQTGIGLLRPETHAERKVVGGRDNRKVQLRPHAHACARPSIR